MRERINDFLTTLISIYFSQNKYSILWFILLTNNCILYGIQSTRDVFAPSEIAGNLNKQLLLVERNSPRE